MATSRRRSNITTQKTEEKENIETLLDYSLKEILEEVEKAEEIPFVEEFITPTPDAGIRQEELTKEPELTPEPTVKAPGQEIKPPPKRHPRNIPKFSHHK